MNVMPIMSANTNKKSSMQNQQAFGARLVPNGNTENAMRRLITAIEPHHAIARSMINHSENGSLADRLGRIIAKDGTHPFYEIKLVGKNKIKISALYPKVKGSQKKSTEILVLNPNLHGKALIGAFVRTVRRACDPVINSLNANKSSIQKGVQIQKALEAGYESEGTLTPMKRLVRQTIAELENADKIATPQSSKSPIERLKEIEFGNG